MRIAYFAHDLSDAAVARRVLMLRTGGAELQILGFRRSQSPVLSLQGIPTLDLGRTSEGKFSSRVALIVFYSLFGTAVAKRVKGADVIIARNLEMFILALAARFWSGSRARLVYECLDIHAMLSGANLKSKVIRAVEKYALARASYLIVSSPAFIEHHFAKYYPLLPKTFVLENKRVLVASEAERYSNIDRKGKWRIGWFGLLRCPKSFEILYQAALVHPELIEVELKGLPTAAVQKLIDRLLPIPNMRFRGAYSQSDLKSMYGRIDFAWSIDYFDEGRNSSWLLPNRIYEGCYYGRPSIALKETQTASWLLAHGVGLILSNPAAELVTALKKLRPDHYSSLVEAAQSVPSSSLIWTLDDCRSLIAMLADQPPSKEARANSIAFRTSKPEVPDSPLSFW